MISFVWCDDCALFWVCLRLQQAHLVAHLKSQFGLVLSLTDNAAGQLRYLSEHANVEKDSKQAFMTISMLQIPATTAAVRFGFFFALGCVFLKTSSAHRFAESFTNRRW